jgi:hypothetical protein
VICSNCGTDNRVGAKFCTECATPLAAGSPTGWLDEARATLAGLEASPFVERLEGLLASTSIAASAAAGSVVQAPAGAPAATRAG